MWVVPLHHSILLENCQKLIPRNVYNIYQEQFHHHFNSDGHNEMEDYKINIIDRAENVLELRHRVIGNTGLIHLFLMG